MLVRDAYDKFRAHSLRRYYLLTTAEPNIAPGNADEIAALCASIRREHGCEVIVNGLVASLKYYLRLAGRPGAFLENYTRALENEYATWSDIKETHREKWRELLTTIDRSVADTHGSAG